MRLYTCDACRQGEHGSCDMVTPAPPGHYGGSMCKCKCRGNPDYMKCEHGNSQLEYCSQCHAQLEQQASAYVRKKTR